MNRIKPRMTPPMPHIMCRVMLTPFIYIGPLAPGQPCSF